MTEHIGGDEDITGVVFDLDTFAVDDGPGIRMAVHFKGCPLRCRWCHGPESQRRAPEVILVRDRCAFCGRCVEVCSHGVHVVTDHAHTRDMSHCVVCGHCVEECPTGALATKGTEMPASAIVERAERMKPFFAHSGGGVTLTGGEVTMQVEFAEAVLAGCRQLDIHTTIETCGACSWEQLARLLPHTDLVLYDLKIMDDVDHQRWTGASNRNILSNAKRLASSDVEVQIRVPLIPGITDTEDNLSDIFAFMRDAGLPSVALLTYNPSASAKYEWIDEPYALDDGAIEPQNANEMEHIRQHAISSGLEAVIG
jgi:pyruvate formate lyase activating enzyme